VSGENMLAHFKEQALFCAAFGSPFTAQLIERFADDLQVGGPVAALVGDWPTSPRADVVSLRLCGALHAAALMGRDARLAALYPARNPDWRMDEIWVAARDFLSREQDWVRDFLRFAPQTNETRRSIGLLAGFLTAAKHWSVPIDVLEIGASAGLNVNWDRFAYRTASWSWGSASSPVLIDTDWNGPPPPVDAGLSVRHRAACDLNPLDITDTDQGLRLRSYIWPDQADRLARFDGAVALALDNFVQVERANAATWLAEKLATRAKDAATIVYHSVFLQYPPPEARAAVIGAIESAGALATENAPLAWVRLEPEALLDGVRDSARFVIDIVMWPGGGRRILGYTDGHVRSIHAL
jgi:hypothetical protein